MGGDYTRVTFDPVKQYAGVLMQQGRVQLDADWNEQIDILERRFRNQAADTFGRAAVPRATTPGAFALTPVAGPPPDLTIGAGRMYIDGLAAEVLEGQAVTYRNQPHYPDPPALEAPGGPAGLIYVDVWQREVTFIEDPELLEIALGGPDTATRLQTVWQVKVAKTGSAEPDCDDLDSLVPAPSGGRLSTQGVAPPASEDPCFIEPAGGYRGLENRLYRVEVHTAGDMNTARFKWSRDNGSVAAAVESLAATGTETELVASPVGRDQVLRFHVDDWVEVTDDDRELMEEPGEMARVTFVDEATRRVVLDRAIPAGTGRAFGVTPAALAERHTRIRRWDQTRDIVAVGGTPTGLVAVSASWLDLEDGVQVRFQIAAGSPGFRVGDHWVFYARTVDGSVETLNATPPRGVIHHYAALGTTTGLGTADVHDCRVLWPPVSGGGCCTVTVGPDPSTHGGFRDLDDAVDALSDLVPDEQVPVQICVLPGEYRLPDPVVIARPRVTVSGCGAASRLIAAGTALVLAAEEISIESLDIAGEGGDTLIEVQADRCRVRDNALRCPKAPALVATGVEGLGVLGNRVREGPGVSVHGEGVLVEGNRLYRTSLQVRSGSFRVWLVENSIASAPLEGGIVLGTAWEDEKTRILADVDIVRNRIRRGDGSGIVSANFDPEGKDSVRILGLRMVDNEIVENVRAGRRGNRDEPPFGGIVLDSARDVVVRGNRIEQNGNEVEAAVCGVYVRSSQGFEAEGNRILDNGPPPEAEEIEGYQGGIVVPSAQSPMGAAGEDGDERRAFEAAPAAVVHGNTVVAPHGHALLLVGIGSMLIEANSLTSRYVGSRDEQNLAAAIRALVGGAGRRDPILKLAGAVGTVLIHDSGVSSAASRVVGGQGFASLALGTAMFEPDLETTPLPGRVLFAGNQVTLDLGRRPKGQALAAMLIASLDEVIVSSNQSECVAPEHHIAADAMVFGYTTRQLGNGLTETPHGCAYSLYSSGRLNTAADNHTTHCVKVTGFRTVSRDNLVMLPNPDLCPEEEEERPAIEVIRPPIRLEARDIRTIATTVERAIEGGRRRSLERILEANREDARLLRREARAIGRRRGEDDPLAVAIGRAATGAAEVGGIAGDILRRIR